jgi:DnaJ-domain-containing protein 1
MPDQPRPSTSDAEADLEINLPGKKDVGTPGADVHGPGGADGKKSKAELSGRLSKEDLDALTPQDIREIMKRLHKGDLAKLDKEVDEQYDKVATLLSGNRREATVAFEILRKARMILLKDPEQFAQAEYLLRQVQARVNQIELSIEAGKRNAPRLFAYQVVWMIFLSIAALVTTVGGTTVSAWIAALLGVEPDSERLNWAVLFLSTLAWGGIGGVTSALWSLYYHISIQRDYDPIENLWYYSQPVLGMVLGGIVFLIMGAGFLIVQVDLAGEAAALGARLLPAAVAVIVGFRQTVVLDLIERAIGLIAPAKPEEEPTLPTPPPSEPI